MGNFYKFETILYFVLNLLSNVRNKVGYLFKFCGFVTITELYYVTRFFSTF